ncbi:MAG: hypothetical protein HZB15_10795 [Actinobacteria bacterium]|nr:hypothetical protein [Actinomycetota bacterium]
MAVVALLAALLVAGCRVDVTVDVAMVQNGSGTVTVTITADRQVVDQAPGLAADLRLDDLEDAGWTTEGPVGTDEGGLSITLARTFDTPEQATAIVASLNGPDGPFEALLFTREASKTAIEYRMAGTIQVDGLLGFADPDLIEAVGATPYLDAIEERGYTVDDAVGLTFHATLPGVVRETTATERSFPLTWTVPFDETLIDVTTTSRTSLEADRSWRVLATLSFVALGLWVLISVVGIVLIARSQHRRRKRRRSLAALIELEARDDPF